MNWMKIPSPALFLVFCFSFVLPALGIYQVRKWIHPSEVYPSSSSSLLVAVSPAENLFPHPVIIRGSGNYIRVPHTSSLVPSSLKDFVIFSWIRPHDLPKPKERDIFVLKYDAESPSRTGFGMALARGRGEGISPEVYWRDATGKGGWYSFAETPFYPNMWMMLAVSYRRGKSLGVHAVVYLPGQKTELKVLGGYEVSDIAPPAPTNDLFFGSPEHSEFTGEVGAFGILTPARGSLSHKNSLKDFLKGFVGNPNPLMNDVDDDAISFWADGEGLKNIIPPSITVEYIRTRTR